MLLPGRPESRLHTPRVLFLNSKTYQEDKVRVKTSVCRGFSGTLLLVGDVSDRGSTSGDSVNLDP